MMKAMNGDLLDVGQNIMEAGVDGSRNHIRRQLEGLQLYHQGWQS